MKKLLEFFASNPLCYNQTLREFKDKAKCNHICVHCILPALAVKTWFQSMRTLFGWLKKKTSGQGAKPLTERQKWMKANFSFLSAHLCIQADHSQLSRVHTPALQVDLEGEDEGGDNEDASSVTSSQAPIQLPSSS